MEKSVDHLSEGLYSGDSEVIAQFFIKYGFTISLVLCVLLLILGLVGIISNSMLLQGVKKRKGDLFISWLVWESIGLVLFVVSLGWGIMDDIVYK